MSPVRKKRRMRKTNALTHPCLVCGGPIAADSTTCRRCGAEETLCCPRCRSTIRFDHRFCPACGIAISA